MAGRRSDEKLPTISVQFLNSNQNCVKSVRIRSYSGLHFPAFGLNTDRCGVSLHIQSECGKMWTRTTPNTDTFNAVMCYSKNSLLFQLVTMNIYRKQSLRGGVPWNQLKKKTLKLYTHWKNQCRSTIRNHALLWNKREYQPFVDIC